MGPKAIGRWTASVCLMLLVAQPTPPAAADTTALIKYIYLIPQEGPTGGCLASPSSSKPVNPEQLPSLFAGAADQSVVAVYQGLQNPCDFILMATPPPTRRNGVEGFQRSLDLPPEADYTQSFALTSSFLLGNERLGATPTSTVWFHHVDAGPGRTAKMPDNFALLFQQLSTFSGFQGLQVWTWRNRPNHWTVITSWTDPASSLRARRDPAVIRAWDAIQLYSAAPKQTYPFRLIQGP